MIRLAAVLAAAVLAAGPHRGAGTIQEDSYRSAALGGVLPFAVYLPPGYAEQTTRYPVIYFLHGLPASPFAYSGIGFLARALDRSRRPAILVAPRGARDGDADPEYLDWGPGRNWETAIARELPAYVDSRYRTIASRAGRALVGLSAGGYGAVLLAIHYLQTFSAVESWSGYFHPTDPTGASTLDLAAVFRRHPTFFAFYVGTSDRRFRAENEQLDAELRAAGVPHLFAAYQGAHEQTFWNAHAMQWLALALAHLAPAH